MADSIPERLRALVYVDAFLPLGGESLADIAGMPVVGAALVPYWADLTAPYPRDVAHPAGTLRQPLELDGGPGAGVPAGYILTREAGQEVDDFEGMAARARELGWPVHELEADHNAQSTNPEGLVRLIQEIGGG